MSGDDGDAPRIGVVGAGITGLALTHYLAGHGVDCVTFEADEEAGGVIDSRREAGTVLERGPQRLRLTDALSGLVDDVGIRDEVIEADDDLPLYVYAKGDLRLVPRSLSAFLRTDLLSWRGKARLLAEPLFDDIDPEESAADAFSRKFGREAYENLIGPVFGGTYGSDPAEMPAKHALSGMMRIEAKHGNLLRPAFDRVVSGGDTPPPASFRDGLQRLPEALAAEHDDRVRLDTPVLDVEPVDGDGEDDDGTEEGYVLRTPDGETRVDEVVVTTSAATAADLFDDLAPDSAAALRELTYNPLALVHLRSDADPDGFGYQVRRSEPIRTLGVTWNASLFDRDGLYTAFLGGMHDPDAMDLPADDLGEIAAEEFETVMGEAAEVLDVTKMSRAFPAYDGSWDALDRVNLPEGVTLATNYTARMGVPSRAREAKRLAGEFADRYADD